VGADVVKVERPRPVTTFRIRKEHGNPVSGGNMTLASAAFGSTSSARRRQRLVKRFIPTLRRGHGEHVTGKTEAFGLGSENCLELSTRPIGDAAQLNETV
jgi:hypothetical protein